MAEKFGPFVSVLDLLKPKDKKSFRDALYPEGRPRAKSRRPRAANRIEELVLKVARTAVVEKEYIDLDFRASYARFYIQRHLDLDRRCTRIHFFSCALSAADLGALDLAARRAYLGYVIIRPFTNHALGRSVFSEQVLRASVPRDYETYLTCRANQRANLAGNELRFLGVPWMQQDNLVSACASASLWVVNWHMSHRHVTEFRQFYSPEITDIAVQSVMETGRAMPSAGLTMGQMMYALREMGYDPLPVQGVNEQRVRTRLYQYVEGGIPVIINLETSDGGHAVTAVGHTFDRSRQFDIAAFEFENQKQPFVRSSEFVPHFVIQDDAYGPFSLLELVDWESAWADPKISTKLKEITCNGSREEIEHEYACAVIVDRESTTERISLLSSLIVPLPAGVSLAAHEAEERAVSLVFGWYKVAGLKLPQLVFRTFLQTSNELKESWNPKRPGMPEELSTGLRSHLFSRWVWVTEVATFKQFFRNEGYALGQVIDDSASQGEAKQKDQWIAYHLPPDDLQTRDPSGKVRQIRVPRYESFPIRDRRITNSRAENGPYQP